MKDSELHDLAKALTESSLLHKRTHARLLAIEDALKTLGISQEFLTVKFDEHLLDRQVRDEDLLGPSEAIDLWSDEDDQGTSQSQSKE